jgi:hypothetical protein
MQRASDNEIEVLLEGVRRCVGDAYRLEQRVLVSMVRDQELIEQARTLVEESRALLDRSGP